MQRTHTYSLIKKGFTLIELLVVVTIIALLACFIWGISASPGSGDVPLFINYEWENYIIQKQQLEEQRRFNDLKEQEMRLQFQQK